MRAPKGCRPPVPGCLPDHPVSPDGNRNRPATPADRPALRSDTMRRVAFSCSLAARRDRGSTTASESARFSQRRATTVRREAMQADTGAALPFSLTASTMRQQWAAPSPSQPIETSGRRRRRTATSVGNERESRKTRKFNGLKHRPELCLLLIPCAPQPLGAHVDFSRAKEQSPAASSRDRATHSGIEPDSGRNR